MGLVVAIIFNGDVKNNNNTKQNDIMCAHSPVWLKQLRTRHFLASLISTRSGVFKIGLVRGRLRAPGRTSGAVAIRSR